MLIALLFYQLYHTLNFIRKEEINNLNVELFFNKHALLTQSI